MHLFNWHQRESDERTFGERVADNVANGMGSWAFIIGQTLIVALWVVVNFIAYFNHFDPYPFILLNLLFSTQAAYAAPIIMMSQNRQSERDRVQAASDYAVNKRAEAEIQDMQRDLEDIKRQLAEATRLIKSLSEKS